MLGIKSGNDGCIMGDSKLLLERLEAALNLNEGRESAVAKWITDTRHAIGRGEKFEFSKEQHQKLIDITYDAYATKKYDLGDAIFYDLISDFNVPVSFSKQLNLLSLLSFYDTNKGRVKHAVERGADIFAAGLDRKPSFIIALENEALEVFDVYHAKDAKVLKHQDDHGNDLLKIAAKAKKYGSFEHVLNLSIASGIDLLNKKNKSGKMVLHTLASIPMAPISIQNDESSTYNPHKGMPLETVKSAQDAIYRMITLISRYERSFKIQLKHEDDKRKRPYDYCRFNAISTHSHIESIERDLTGNSTANGIRDGSKLAEFERIMAPQKTVHQQPGRVSLPDKAVGTNGNGNPGSKLGIR